MPLLVLLGCIGGDGFGVGLPPGPAEAPPPIEADTTVDAFVVGDETSPPVSFHLSRLPVAGTIAVVVTTPNGAQFEFFEAVCCPPVGDWIYDPSANAVILLTYVPEAGATVTLTYRRAGS